MRIISGEFKSRYIKVPKYFHDRPTTDQAKEGLFNIVYHSFDIENLRVLDLFAGTGNISYEFASRGCKNIVAVDKNPKYIDFIRKTARELFPDQSVIQAIQSDAFKLLTIHNQTYDIIFADPPFDEEDTARIPDLVFENQMLLNEGTLIVEHPRQVDFSGHTNFQRRKKYGKVNFSFFFNEK